MKRIIVLLGLLPLVAFGQPNPPPSTPYTRDFLKAADAAAARAKLALVVSNWAFNANQLEQVGNALQIKSAATVTNAILAGQNADANHAAVTLTNEGSIYAGGTNGDGLYAVAMPQIYHNVGVFSKVLYLGDGKWYQVEINVTNNFGVITNGLTIWLLRGSSADSTYGRAGWTFDPRGIQYGEIEAELDADHPYHWDVLSFDGSATNMTTAKTAVTFGNTFLETRLGGTNVHSTTNFTCDGSLGTYASMSSAANIPTISTTGSGTPVAPYDRAFATANMIANKTTGAITNLVAGWYMVSWNISGSADVDDTLFAEVWTNRHVAFSGQFSALASGCSYSLPPTLMWLPANTEVQATIGGSGGSSTTLATTTATITVDKR